MPEPTMPGPEVQPPAAAGGQDPTAQPAAQPQPSGAAPATFEIDGQKLSADDVRAALKAKTDYDRLTPEFTKARMILTDPQRFKDFGSKQYPDLFPQQPGQLSDEEKQKQDAIATLESLGVITKGQAKEFATKRDIEEAFAQREADTFVKSEVDRLSKEWDGVNGKPKFNPKEVLIYAAEHDLPPEDAFWKMKRPELLDWHAAQKAAGKLKAPVIATPGGGAAIPNTPDKKVDFHQPGAVAKAFLETLEAKE